MPDDDIAKDKAKTLNRLLEGLKNFMKDFINGFLTKLPRGLASTLYGLTGGGGGRRLATAAPVVVVINRAPVVADVAIPAEPATGLSPLKTFNVEPEEIVNRMVPA
jgi:hypothetical protein